MTLPYERTNAVIAARELLLELHRTPGPIRKRALQDKIRVVLKHYPTPYEMEDPVKLFAPYRGSP